MVVVSEVPGLVGGDGLVAAAAGDGAASDFGCPAFAGVLVFGAVASACCAALGHVLSHSRIWVGLAQDSDMAVATHPCVEFNYELVVCLADTLARLGG